MCRYAARPVPQSLESIQASGGDDVDTTKLHDFDAEVLLDMVPNADLFELSDD